MSFATPPAPATAFGRRPGPLSRLADWLGVHETWQRPTPPVDASDVRLALGFTAFAVLALELMRGYADFTGARSRPAEYPFLLGLMVLLLWRRRAPLLMMVLATAVFVATGIVVPEIAYSIGDQAVVFFLYYSAVAWARDRRGLMLALGGVVLTFAVWMTWDYTQGHAIEQVVHNQMHGHGLLGPLPSWILYFVLINAAYIGGATLVGQSDWRAARAHAQVAEQGVLISDQADRLRDQAVVDERLRIARELHDVVAHHVSVMGIQAAGARRVLATQPDAATEALTAVEEASRQAVTEMRRLLGTLRGATPADSSEPADTAPEPTVAMLPALVASHGTGTFHADYQLVEHTAGAADSLPRPLSLSLYRVTQEALANVRRHSTAQTAHVTLRVDTDAAGRAHAEVEVVDSGRPRTGTSGTGLGLLGIRERVAAHGGIAEIGPRLTGGYRVRVRFPVQPTNADPWHDGVR